MATLPFRLVTRNIARHPVRSLLTIGSLVVAFFLMCTLRSLVVTLDAGVKAARSDRLIVQSAVSLFVILPESYEAKIRNVDGVEATCRWTWFGGYYQDPGNFFGQFATGQDTLLGMYPEIRLVAGTAEDFLGDRRSCLIGDALAARFGWTVGSNAPLLSPIFPRADGSAWDFRVAGIYHSDSSAVDNQTMFFHHDYLAKSVEDGAALGPEGVGIYSVKVADGVPREPVMRRIDQLFENGPQRVQTSPEAEFQAQFVSMVGNLPLLVSSIGGGVFFAILLAVLNTLLMASREQTRDVGILRALGFGRVAVFLVLLLQGLFLTAVGGGAGIALAGLASAPIATFLGAMFPNYQMSGETAALGAILAAGIGIVAAIGPAWWLSRKSCVDALRSEA